MRLFGSDRYNTPGCVISQSFSRSSLSTAFGACCVVVLPSQTGRRARQDRRRRPGLRPLASPFALRRELLPTSPNYLNDTSATPLTAARSSHPLPSRLHACSRFAPGHQLAAIYHTHRSEPAMSSVRPAPRPPPLAAYYAQHPPRSQGANDCTY